MEAELADGTILEFPDGTDPLVIQDTVKKMLGATQQPTTPVQPTAPIKPPIRTDIALPNAESMQKASSVVNPVGIGETALQIGSGLASTAVGGLAGLVGSVLPGPEGQGAKWSQAVQHAGTYEPRTEAGKTVSGAVNTMGSGVAHVFKEGGRYVGKQYGLENEGEFAGEMYPVVASIFGLKKPVTSIANTPYTGTGIPELVSGVKSALPTAQVARTPATQEALAVTQQQRAVAASNADWQRAAPIDAAKIARENQIVLNPASVSDGKHGIKIAASGGSAHFNTAASIANKNKWNDMVRQDLGIGPNTPLTAKTYDTVRKAISKPYDDAATLGPLTPNESAIKAIRDIDVPEILPAGEQAAAKMKRITDTVAEQLEIGMTGKNAVDTTKTLRKEAKAVFDSVRSGNQVDTVTMQTAKAKMAIAEKIDETISSNITDPKWKTSFDDSRRKMAQSYAYERATNLVRQQVDPQVFAQEMQGRHQLTGNAAKMGEIAGNFPEIANVYAERGTTFSMPVRSGVAGTTGFAIGSLYGSPVATSATAAGLAAMGEKFYGKRLRGESAQKKYATPVDRRMPIKDNGMLTGNTP